MDGKTFIVAYCLIILLTFGLVCEIMDHENGFEDTDDKENIFSLQYCGLKKSLPYRNCVIYSFLVSYSFKFRLFGDLKLNLKKEDSKNLKKLSIVSEIFNFFVNIIN